MLTVYLPAVQVEVSEVGCELSLLSIYGYGWNTVSVCNYTVI